MPSNLFREAPPVVFVIAACCFLAVLLSRGMFRLEDSPAFLYQKQTPVFVELSGANLVAGVRQISDETGILSAIKMTVPFEERFYLSSDSQGFTFVSGEKISVVKKGRQISIVHDGWISAGQRIALGISLHPDQMVREDWVALPGIGEALAERIDTDRQINGDFGSLDALVRVKGIGKKSIEKLSAFF